MLDKNETLYVVHSIEDAYEKLFEVFEGVTNNFDAWLKEHNKIRAEKGWHPKDADDFSVEELKISLF